MAGRGLFTRDFIAKNQWIWICEYAGELQHASSFPGGFPQSAKGNTHTRGVEPMFSRLQVKNLTPQNANGKLASFANDKRDSKTNSAAFQRKHVTTKRTRKQVWLKATKPINPGAEIFVTYSRDYWKRQDEDDVGVEVSPPPPKKLAVPSPTPLSAHNDHLQGSREPNFAATALDILICVCSTSHFDQYYPQIIFREAFSPSR